LKPRKGELDKPRLYGPNKWYWCSEETGGKCAGKWRRHKPSECNPEKYAKSATSEKRKSDETKEKDAKKKFKKGKPKMRLSKAMETIIRNDKEYESDSSDASTAK
jgi:hypothetical protein